MGRTPAATAAPPEPAKRQSGRPAKAEVEAREPKPPAPPKRRSLGVIRRDEVYTPQEVQERLRFGGKTLRWAYGRGLKSVWMGHVKVIRGADFDDFLAEEAERQKGERASEADREAG